jgi:manganese transport protein
MSVSMAPPAGLGGAPLEVAPASSGALRRFFSFAGPGVLVAVGYIDPGNWATDLAGGSRYSYALLSVVLASSLMAMLLQALSARLGIASGNDLAVGCRQAWPRAAVPLWVLAEIAVAATDLAEVIGSAVALELLFHIPLPLGVALTALDVLVLLGLEQRGMRRLEAAVGAMVLLVAACFAFELVLSRPEPAGVLAGYLPRGALFHDRGMLYIAVGILGATVMPHNLYLHSSLVQTRAVGRGEAERRSALRHATLDALLALGGAMLINSAILVLAASVFCRAGLVEVADLRDAHRLLSPLLGSAGASTVFAVALLAAGQSATVTGTMAGQVVMTGFLRVRLPPWARRLLTRSLAIVPALAAALWAGERGAGDLLVASQVILSLHLPFAVVPLLLLSADRRRMGALVSPRWMTAAGWVCAGVIVALNGVLIAMVARGAG